MVISTLAEVERFLYNTVQILRWLRHRGMEQQIEVARECMEFESGRYIGSRKSRRELTANLKGTRLMEEL